MSPCWFLLLPLAWAGLNFGIRRGLTAERVVETADPGELPWQAVRIPTLRGRQLFGWFIPSASQAPALVIMHGWGGNAQMMLPLAAPLHAVGYTLLLLDARCHGRSDADSFASLPRFAEDLECAIDWLKRQPEVDAGRIGVIGHSVGAAAALLTASRRRDVAAAVSLAAFAHPDTMMRRWLAAKGIPQRPLGAYILFYVQWVIGHRFDEIAPCNTIRRVSCPVLLAHGSADDTVPASDAALIYANRPDERVRLVSIPGSHDQYADLPEALETLIAFLNGAMNPDSVLARADEIRRCP